MKRTAITDASRFVTNTTGNTHKLHAFVRGGRVLAVGPMCRINRPPRGYVVEGETDCEDCRAWQSQEPLIQETEVPI